MLRITQKTYTYMSISFILFIVAFLKELEKKSFHMRPLDELLSTG